MTLIYRHSLSDRLVATGVEALTSTHYSVVGREIYSPSHYEEEKIRIGNGRKMASRDFLVEMKHTPATLNLIISS